MSVSVCRPLTRLYASTGLKSYSPPGFGAVMEWTTRGPAEVQRVSRVYVTPGTSSVAVVAVAAVPGRARAERTTARQARLSIPWTKTHLGGFYNPREEVNSRL